MTLPLRRVCKNLSVFKKKEKKRNGKTSMCSFFIQFLCFLGPWGVAEAVTDVYI